MQNLASATSSPRFQWIGLPEVNDSGKLSSNIEDFPAWLESFDDMTLPVFFDKQLFPIYDENYYFLKLSENVD